jgi:hypothetical protein
MCITAAVVKHILKYCYAWWQKIGILLEMQQQYEMIVTKALNTTVKYINHLCNSK